MMFAGVFVGVEDGLDNLVFALVIECLVVLFFMDKSKYAGFSLSIETVSSLPFKVSLKYLGCLSTTWNGQEEVGHRGFLAASFRIKTYL